MVDKDVPPNKVEEMSDASQYLRRLHEGDLTAAESLLNLIYQELRQMARSVWAKPDQTLRPTSLVHDAWERLVGYGAETKPKAIVPTSFSVGDIRDLPSFSGKLQAGSDAVSAFILGRLDGSTRKALAQNEDRTAGSSVLQGLLVQALNELVGGPLIYEAGRFAGVALRPETAQLLEIRQQEMQNLAQQKERTGKQQARLMKMVQGEGFGRLNRLLLEDAYPAELSRDLNKRQFMSYAARAMKRIIIEHHRTPRPPWTFPDAAVGQDQLDFVDLAVETLPSEVQLAVGEAVEQLEAEHPAEAELVYLRFYVGLSIPAAAELLQISASTAKRQWSFARAFLYVRLKDHRKA
jgi:hypothetical protein